MFTTYENRRHLCDVLLYCGFIIPQMPGSLLSIFSRCPQMRQNAFEVYGVLSVVVDFIRRWGVGVEQFQERHQPRCGHRRQEVKKAFANNSGSYAGLFVTQTSLIPHLENVKDINSPLVEVNKHGAITQ